jgi:hypothetical protein
MLGRRAYVIGWNCQAQQWQVRSASGFVLLESDSRREVATVCARLNRRFPGRRRRATNATIQSRVTVVSNTGERYAEMLCCGVRPAFG